MGQRIEDFHVLMVLCAHNESWFSALVRHVRNSFNASDAILERIVQSCQEEAFVSRCEHAPRTVCYHHDGVCGKVLPLAYDVLHLKACLPAKDRALLEPMLQEPLKTKEIHDSLDAFPSIQGIKDHRRVTHISHEWRWMSKQEAANKDIFGLQPPEQDVKKAKFTQEQQHLASLLIGIENSAPLKDDLFGHSHTTEGKSKDVSAFGSRKWRDFRRGGQDVPADLGGIHVCVDENCFRRLREVCKSITLREPSALLTGDKDDAKEEKELFQKLLQSPDQETEAILREHMGSATAL